MKTGKTNTKKKEPVDRYSEVALPEFCAIEKRIAENGDVLYILVPKDDRPECCPACGDRTIYVHKKRTLRVKDLDQFGKRVGLMIQGHTYRCDNCGTLIVPEFESLSGRLTKRLANRIEEAALSDTFAKVAEQYHVSSPTVATIFNDMADRKLLQYRFISPTVLGLDEVHLNDDYRGVFVGIEKTGGRVLEFTKERTKKSVTKTLMGMENPENLKLVTMDMWKPYKDAVRTVFPDVPIVIDHFHVIKELIKEMDVVRAAVCKGIRADKERISLKHNRFLMLKNAEDLSSTQGSRLKELLELYPSLEIIYTLKEAFRDIYINAKSSEEARKLFAEWEDACASENVSAYNTLISMIHNWEGEIFAYFDYPDMERTNAQTESLNRTIKDIARDGRGYNFDVLRKKILLRRYHFVPEEKYSFDAFFEE